jgi:hypothetical protein
MSLDRNGLLNKIVKSVERIDLGRKGFAIEGKEGAGRIFFSTGLLTALDVFKAVHTKHPPYAGHQPDRAPSI